MDLLFLIMMDGKSNDVHNQNILETLLKELRVKSGMRQIDVASELGMQQSMVSKYEVGERRLDILEVRKLCHLFKISLSEFSDLLEERINQKNETYR